MFQLCFLKLPIIYNQIHGGIIIYSIYVCQKVPYCLKWKSLAPFIYYYIWVHAHSVCMRIHKCTCDVMWSPPSPLLVTLLVSYRILLVIQWKPYNISSTLNINTLVACTPPPSLWHNWWHGQVYPTPSLWHNWWHSQVHPISLPCDTTGDTVRCTHPPSLWQSGAPHSPPCDTTSDTVRCTHPPPCDTTGDTVKHCYTHLTTATDLTQLSPQTSEEDLCPFKKPLQWIPSV